MEKIEKKLLEEKDFIGIFGVNELKKFFSIKEKEKKFGKEYKLISKNEKLKCMLERYRIDEDYEVSILNTVGETDKGFFYPSINMNIYEIMYCLHGECIISSGNESYFMKKGSILIYKMNNDNINEYSFKSSNFKKILIFLDIDKLETSLSKSIDKNLILEWKEKVINIFENNIFCYGKTNSEIDILSNQIENMNIDNIDDYLEFKMKIFKFLFLILKLRITPVKEVSINEEEVVMKLKGMIDGYAISEIPTIKEMYETVGISNYHLQKAFKKIEGITIYQYVQKKKMDYSKHLLETSDKNIIDIAMEIGYENPSKFSKTFKKYFGILPSKYLKKN